MHNENIEKFNKSWNASTNISIKWTVKIISRREHHKPNLTKMDYCEKCSRNVSEVINNLDPFIVQRFRLMKTAKIWNCGEASRATCVYFKTLSCFCETFRHETDETIIAFGDLLKFLVEHFMNLIRHRERKSFRLPPSVCLSWSFWDICDIYSEIRNGFVYLRPLFIRSVSHRMIITRFWLLKIHDELRRFQ